jgi:hypothetical protein
MRVFKAGKRIHLGRFCRPRRTSSQFTDFPLAKHGKMGYMNDRRFLLGRLVLCRVPRGLASDPREDREAPGPRRPPLMGGNPGAGNGVERLFLCVSRRPSGPLDKEWFAGKMGVVWLCLVGVRRGSDGSRILDRRPAGMGFQAVATDASRPGFPVVGFGKLARSEKPGLGIARPAVGRRIPRMAPVRG